ncbi:retinitis pigmentosa 1-like 1 protein [Vombatus ursinus]|uniref:retinitis pigmentosa 1-like 1 protein n=1 Tax=Vombatus ursinus TaxID=29139 RepID=UPI000FFD77D6|nr:retinitis pigmentosa 1-like 1 protein [Vombatus ursinus]
MPRRNNDEESGPALQSLQSPPLAPPQLVRRRGTSPQGRGGARSRLELLRLRRPSARRPHALGLGEGGIGSALAGGSGGGGGSEAGAGPGRARAYGGARPGGRTPAGRPGCGCGPGRGAGRRSPRCERRGPADAEAVEPGRVGPARTPRQSWWSVEPWQPAAAPAKAKPSPRPRPSMAGQGHAHQRRSAAVRVKGRRLSAWQQARPRPKAPQWANTRASPLESEASVGRSPARLRLGLRPPSWEPLKVLGCSLLKREGKPPAQPSAPPPPPPSKKPARAPAGRELCKDEGSEQPREVGAPATPEAGATGAEGVQTPGAEGEKTPGAEREQTRGTEGEKTPGAEGEQTRGTEGEKTPGAEGEKTPGAEGEQTRGTEGEKTPGAEGEQISGPESEKTPGAEGEQTRGTEGEKTPGAEGEKTPGAEGEQTRGTEGEKTPEAGAAGEEGKQPQDQGQGQLLEHAEVPSQEEKGVDNQKIEMIEKRAEEGEVLEEGRLKWNEVNKSFSSEGGNLSQGTGAQCSELELEATTDSPATTALGVKEVYVNQREYEEESLVRSDAHEMMAGEQLSQGAEEEKQALQGADGGGEVEKEPEGG